MSSYTPSRFFRNGHNNTLVAASALRKAYALNCSKTLRSCSQSQLLSLPNDVCLQVLLNKQEHVPSQPLVLILHGWLGCAESLYLLPLANQLYSQGFNVARLNYRDHGGTEHLNKDLFHSCRLNEVIHAAEAIQKQTPHSSFYIVGFSLGGNFALRIGAEANKTDLQINKIISICPVMDATNALNETQNMLKIYSEYYLRRWKNILKRKHKHFPDIYDLNTINSQRSLDSMTQHLLLKYTEFNSVEKYLKGYSITEDRLATLNTESHVYIAEDDPVIPARDRDSLYPSKNLNIHLTQFGGHCGYLQGLFSVSWIDQQILNHLRA